MELNKLVEIKKKDFLSRSRDKSPLARYNRRVEVSTRLQKVVFENFDLNILFEAHSSQEYYIVSLKFPNFKSSLLQKLNGLRTVKRSELRRIVQSLLRDYLSTQDLRISCTCPDYYYRFSYLSTIDNYNSYAAQRIPALIRNPLNQGSGCKHSVRVLTTTSRWQPRAITLIIDEIISPR